VTYRVLCDLLIVVVCCGSMNCCFYSSFCFVLEWLHAKFSCLFAIFTTKHGLFF